MLRHLLTGLIGMLLTACNNKQMAPPFIDTSNASFSKEIPHFNDGTIDFNYPSVKEKLTQLGLNSLENGFSNLQIRVWYNYARGTERNLVVIKNKDSVWTATVYYYRINYSQERERIVSKEIYEVVPKIGWNSFVKELFDLKVTTLPNMEDIPGLEDNWKDGDFYSIEVATPKRYRFYSYHVPEEFLDNYWQARNMVLLINLFTEELGVRSVYSTQHPL